MRSTQNETRMFLQPYRSGGDLHARLGAPVLAKKLDEVKAERGEGAACELAQSALEVADLSTRARDAARTFLAQHNAVVMPSSVRTDSAKRFEYRMTDAQREESPGKSRILKGEVVRTIDSLQGRRIPRLDVRNALANPNLSEGAFVALQDYLATGRVRTKGDGYHREASAVAGDRFVFQAKGSQTPVELEVVAVKRGLERVEVASKYSDKAGGIVNREAFTYEVREVGKDTKSILTDRDLGRGKVLGGEELAALPVSAELKARYAKAPEEWVYEDHVHSSVSLEKTGDTHALRVGGHLFKAGDGARIHVYLDGEDRYHEAELSLRAVRQGADGRPEVIADEFMAPGRMRTRKLLPGELGLLDRETFYAKFVESYRQDMPELTVVTYPKKAPGIYGERVAFRVKDDVFTTGDDVFIAADKAGAKPLGAKILTIEAGEYPQVMVKLETGEARELTQAEVGRLSIDQLSLLERPANHDPRPTFEVIRAAGQPPFVLMGDEKVHTGDFVVFDRCSPGVIPMVIDRIEQKNGKDVVWIQEPMPLTEGGEKVRETISFGGRRVQVSYENWPEGSPELAQKTPAIMTYTRPLGEFEYHLMKSEKARLSEVHESKERTRHMDVREDSRVQRFEALQKLSPKKAAAIFDEQDVERMKRRASWVREPEPKYGHFNLEDLGWALSRSHSGMHYGRNNEKLLMLRGTRIEKDSGLVYRRDGKETPMKVLEVIGGETLRVAFVEDGKLVRKQLAKQDGLFLFPDEGAVAKIDQLRRRARAEKMLAAV